MTTPTPTPAGRTFAGFREIADFLWQNAERLRGAPELDLGADPFPSDPALANLGAAP